MSYSRKILLIYFSKTVSIGTGFLSMLVVMPLLASNSDVFGIYTLCANLSLFFSYTDIGFLSAGQKYAAEYFARGDLNKEMRILGFVLFVTFILTLIVSCTILVVAFNPQVIIRSASPNDLTVASELLMVLSFSGVNVLFQRFNLLIYSIRLEDYVYQTIDVLSNLIKLACAHLFLTKTGYNIVGYFASIQVISLIASLISVVISFKRYHYDARCFLLNFGFSKEIYNLTKGLALSSVVSTIAFILYFELDALILGVYFGVKGVVLYTIGLTLASFLRNFYNMICSPFLPRFNHCVGSGDEGKLNSTFKLLIKITLPLCVIPPIVLSFYIQDVISIWVGEKYLSSACIARLYIINASLSGGLLVPIVLFLIANSQDIALRRSAVLLPIIFYGSFFILKPFVGSECLAIAKLVTTVSNILVTFYYLYRALGKTILIYYRSILKKILIPVCLMSILFIFFPSLDYVRQKSFMGYLNLFGNISPSLVVPLFFYYMLDSQSRLIFFEVLRGFYKIIGASNFGFNKT